MQSGGCLGKHLGPLLKTGLPLRKSILKSLPKSILIPLGLIAAASAADAGIHKKNSLFKNAKQTTLIISNEEMVDIMKIIKCLEESGLLVEVLAKQLNMKQKNKKVDFIACHKVH